MFLVKLVARPDARLVEVPLEIEAELPRDFEGTVLLAASGLPRRVKLKAPKDTVKLSTAYRTDQLLADLARSALRSSPEEAARVQEAALAFVRSVRERRTDGATLLLRMDTAGRVEVFDPAAQAPKQPGPETRQAKPAPARAAETAAATAAARADPAAQGTVSDRLAALERKVSQLESARAKRPLDETAPADGLAGAEPAPKAPRARGALRRGTAVDAFSDGLRKELSGRATQLLGAADRAASACDQATRLAAEAVRDLAAPPLGSEGDVLHRLATEAAARQRALQRFLDEVDLYAPAELLMAERLLARLSPVAPEGSPLPDPAGPLSALGEQLLRDGSGNELLGVWIARAAPLCAWTLIEPRPAEPLRPSLHDAGAGAAEGAPIGRLLVPGVLRADGTVAARARVSLAGESPEAAELAQTLRELPPAQPAASGSGAPAEEISVSDDDVEAEEDLGPGGGASASAREPTAVRSGGKPWEE